MGKYMRKVYILGMQFLTKFGLACYSCQVKTAFLLWFNQSVSILGDLAWGVSLYLSGSKFIEWKNMSAASQMCTSDIECSVPLKVHFISFFYSVFFIVVLY